MLLYISFTINQGCQIVIRESIKNQMVVLRIVNRNGYDF